MKNLTLRIPLGYTEADQLQSLYDLKHTVVSALLAYCSGIDEVSDDPQFLILQKLYSEAHVAEHTLIERHFKD